MLGALPVLGLHLAGLAQLGDWSITGAGAAPLPRPVELRVTLRATGQAAPGRANVTAGASATGTGGDAVAGAPEPPQLPTAPAPVAAMPTALRGRQAEPGIAADPPAALRQVDADYLPRAALSRPARALDPIEIAYPEGSPVGDYRAVLLLFVDETGKVQRVRPREPGLPLGLEDAARSAFMAARFAPGEVDGRLVRSILAVEVTFNALPQPASAVSRSAP
jgi:hypothetical protein